MKSKSFSVFLNIVITVGVCAAIVFFVTTLTHALVAPAPEQQATVEDASQREQALEVASSSIPVHLIIPTINVDANVQETGITKKGNIGIPTNFKDVAWYKYGTIPGKKGTAIIDGHVDNALSLAGVFKHLSELKGGDDVIVVDRDGTRLHFVVIDTRVLSATSTDTETVLASQGYAGLNLITCEGTWEQSVKEYSERRIIFTKLTQIEMP